MIRTIFMGPTALHGIGAMRDTQSPKLKAFIPYNFGSTVRNRTPDVWTTGPPSLPLAHGSFKYVTP